MKSHYLFVLILFVGCQQSPSHHMVSKEAGPEMDEVMEASSPLRSVPDEPSESSPSSLSKKVVKTGSVTFESKSVEDDYQKIRLLLPKFRGYIENESQNKSAQRINYSLTIRVPADGYDSVYQSVSKLAYRLDNKQSNIEDVTERYYDLKSRIKNKKALEQRYVELLKKAIVIKDILEIEDKLNQVRTDVERLEGQFRYLSKRISLSTIHLSFYEILPYTYETNTKKGFGARLLSALDDGWQGFLSFIIGISTIWPFFLLAFAGVFLFKWIRKTWRNK